MGKAKINESGSALALAIHDSPFTLLGRRSVTGKVASRDWGSALAPTIHDSPFTASLQLGKEFLHALQPIIELPRRARVADAQRARFAECDAGHAGHALGFEQRIAEV